MRTVVVGASSGLGRCIGTGLAQRGATVALLARRRARLDDAAKEAGPGTLAIECDVTDESSVRCGDRRSRVRARRHRRARLRAGHRSTGAPRRHRRGHVARRVRHERHRRGARHERRDPPSDRLGRHRRVPVVGQRIAHPAVARPRRVRGEQGRTRQAGRGVARRAPERRLHTRRGRRLRGRRGRLADRVPDGVGRRSGYRAPPDLGGARLPQRHAHRRRPPGDAGRRRVAGRRDALRPVRHARTAARSNPA